MRVMMQLRPHSVEVGGGDFVQAEKTCRALQALGVQAELTTVDRPDLSGVEVVHVFGVFPAYMPYTYRQVVHARRHGVPALVSTIYWNPAPALLPVWELYERSVPTSGLTGRLRTLLRRFARAELLRTASLEDWLDLSAARAQQEATLILADMLLPNTRAELGCLRRDFPSAQTPGEVIPNAADTMFSGASPDAFIQRWGLRDFVLCVGRIERRKNQEALIRALRGTGTPLVLIGRPTEPEYCRMCSRLSDGNVLLLDHLPHDELPSAYAAAKVHCLPSHYETPGIASLEAALAGCNVVVTEPGGAREYFGDLAWYCRPDDEESIREATLAALAAPRRADLMHHVLENYTWEVTARRTLEVYRLTLENACAETRPCTY